MRDVPGQHAAALASRLVVVAGLVLLLVTDSLSAYRNLQLADGAYYFCALAGLTVLAGLERADLARSRRAHGGRRVHGGQAVGSAGWALIPELAGGGGGRRWWSGILVGVAASRLRGPYLAGATLAFAVGLPALADKFPDVPRRRERPDDQSADAARRRSAPTFPLERWQAWIACAGALVVVFVLLQRHRTAAIGRSLRAVRDDEIAASLCGLRVGAHADAGVHRQRRCAGLGGGLLAVVSWNWRRPGAFPLQLSLTLLAGVVIGGLGSLVGAVWGAALLVLLPNWTNDLAQLVLAVDERVGATCRSRSTAWC